MHRVWYWLIEIPATIVTVWWVLYRLFLIVFGLFCFFGILTALVLYWGFGIRWGW